MPTSVPSDSHPQAPPAVGIGEPLPTSELPPVTELVERAGALHPTRPAVSSGDASISYRALDIWAARLSRQLSEAGAARDRRVAVLIPPGMGMIAAVLAVLRTGAAYVPIDPAQPAHRVDRLLADARVCAAVVVRDTAPLLAAHGLPLIHAEEAPHPDEAASPEAEADPGAGPPAAAGAAPDQPAYLIYTSGSTGEPKGVVVEHAQLSASTLARHAVYPGTPVFLLVSPLVFDSSVAGVWGTLTAGGHLVVASADEVRDPERLLGAIERHGVTHLLCVPSLYGLLLDAAERLGIVGPGATTPDSGGPRTLTTVVVAGEPLPEQLVARHFDLCPGTELVNEYGPTEATVWASYQRFTRPGPVSIGRPVPGARLYVLDARTHPVAAGEEGELYIGGAGVARGYLDRPDETRRAFLPDPFADRPGVRMYRTGDLVRWNPDGTLAFLGRRDHQVKVRGHRVELGAVEVELLRVPGVREAVVVPDGAGGLTGFVRAGTGQSPSALVAVRERLVDRLPAVMVPTQVVVLTEFPRTANGKADREGLRARAATGQDGARGLSRDAPQDTSPSEASPDVAPDTPLSGVAPLAARVQAAWSEVLRRQQVPMDTNFFDLGGHSLAMVQLQDALERHTGSRPAVVSLFQHTTVAAQAALLDHDSASPEGREDASSGVQRRADRRARALQARRLRARTEVAQ